MNLAHLADAVARFHDRHVEGAATQIEDQQIGAYIYIIMYDDDDGDDNDGGDDDDDDDDIYIYIYIQTYL